jgi:hypothetical protein
MSLATYGDLKTAVATWLNRSDLTAYVPDLIRLGEQRMFYGGEAPLMTPPLRIPAMQAQETGTITASSIAFPTRFLEPIRLVASSGGESWALQYAAPERFTETANSAAVPSSYTYLANAIKVAGTGAASYTLDYYQAFASLSADADTNWVLTNAPGIYLYASLIEAGPFLKDDGILQRWAGMLSTSIAAVNRATRMQGGGALAVRLRM